jgi:hypothetical protein
MRFTMRHFAASTLAAALIAAFPALPGACGEPPSPRFEAQEIDAAIGIGYGLSIGDIDGDRRPDIILADKSQIVWYRNPDWRRIVFCESLTPQDNVCVAARDIDFDGKVELAVGAGWNPGDTVSSGSVHYLLPPKDRGERWEPIALHHEPTVHRMHWAVDRDGGFSLVVAPLHGRGNRNGEGEGVKVYSYIRPADPRGAWKLDLVDDSLHVLHNLELVQWDHDVESEILLAGREGVFYLDRGPEGWQRRQLAGNEDGESAFKGASEIRAGLLPGGLRCLATIEPFHGHEVVTYTPSRTRRLWQRTVLDDSLKEGHAVACADLIGIGSDQLIVGWRGKDADGKVGLRLYTPLDAEGKRWRRSAIDDNRMACEDLRVADLDGDGRLDIVAAGRATRNVIIYWNRGLERGGG